MTIQKLHTLGHREHPRAIPNLNPPPPPQGGQHVYKVQTTVQANMVKLASHRCRKILVPHLKGLVNRPPHLFVLKMLGFLGVFFLVLKKAGFVQPFLISSPLLGIPLEGSKQGLYNHFDHSQPWGPPRRHG